MRFALNLGEALLSAPIFGRREERSTHSVDAASTSGAARDLEVVQVRRPRPASAILIAFGIGAIVTGIDGPYFAESVALFAIVMGIALLLTGIGLLVVTVRWLREPASAARQTPGVAPKPIVVT